MSVASENPGHAVVNAQIYRRTSGLVLVGYTEVIPKPPSRKYLKQTVAALGRLTRLPYKWNRPRSHCRVSRRIGS
jgi:hypothetical protein